MFYLFYGGISVTDEFTHFSPEDLLSASTLLERFIIREIHNLL